MYAEKEEEEQVAAVLEGAVALVLKEEEQAQAILKGVVTVVLKGKEQALTAIRNEERNSTRATWQQYFSQATNVQPLRYAGAGNAHKTRRGRCKEQRMVQLVVGYSLQTSAGLFSARN